MRNTAGIIRSMAMTGTALTGRPCHVRQMDEHGQVAYHLRQGKEDVIAVDFQYNFKRTEEESATILYGLFTHEIMHAIRTDSDYVFSHLKEFPPNEQFSRKDIWNIVEDPAIEYFSRWEVSETLYRCLQKAIRYFHDESPTIQECGTDAYLQFVAALVMFGDIGMLKGEFTFPEALECFKKCAPIMLETIEEPDARRRFERSQEIFEIARPLWEEHCKNDLTANASEKDALSELGVSESKGTGSPVSNESYGQDGGSDSAMQRRKMICKALEDLGMENGSLDGSEEDCPGDSGDVLAPQAGNSDSTENGGGSGQGGSPSGKQAENAADAAGHSGDSGSTNGPGLEGMLRKANKKLGEAGSQAALDEQADPDGKADKELQDLIGKMIEAAGKPGGERKKQSRRDLDIDSLKLEVRSPYYKYASVEIQDMDTVNEAAYERLCKNMHSHIVNLRSKIRKVLQGEYTQKVYSTNGKLSVDRMCGRKLTARVFERRKEPDDKTDLAIVLMVDQSSSMEDSIGAVREVCTVIMEAFSTFDIPVKLAGFTSLPDSDARYYHYGKWSNDRKTRMMIPSIQAYGNTFLGHAIRYAGELLNKRPEKRRLLVMITDAAPCYRIYKSKDDAYSDCRYAVQDVGKFADVIGIGIYDQNDLTSKKAFQFIFGRDCISVEEPSAIVRELPKMIGKFLNS